MYKEVWFDLCTLYQMVCSDKSYMSKKWHTCVIYLPLIKEDKWWFTLFTYSSRKIHTVRVVNKKGHHNSPPFMLQKFGWLNISSNNSLKITLLMISSAHVLEISACTNANIINFFFQKRLWQWLLKPIGTLVVENDAYRLLLNF